MRFPEIARKLTFMGTDILIIITKFTIILVLINVDEI